MLAAYATCDDYPHNAYPGRFLNFKIYLLFGVHAGIMYYFLNFSCPWKNLPEIAPNGARRFVPPTNPDLADILGRTDLDFKFVFF